MNARMSMAVAIALAGASCSALGQTNPWEIPKPGTYQGSVELQKWQQQEEAQRQQQNKSASSPISSPGSGASAAEAQASSKAAYETWDKSCVPPERNPLLGRLTWQPAGSNSMMMEKLLDGTQPTPIEGGIVAAREQNGRLVRFGRRAGAGSGHRALRHGALALTEMSMTEGTP